MWALFLMQRIQCMLHIPLQHLFCKLLRLTAIESQSKTLDEAVKLLDLSLRASYTITKDEWWGYFKFPITMISFLFFKKWWFYPNRGEKINRNLSVSTAFCSKQIKCSKPPCVFLSHMVAPCKSLEILWGQQNIMLWHFLNASFFTAESSPTSIFPKPLWIILKNKNTPQTKANDNSNKTTHTSLKTSFEIVVSIMFYRQEVHWADFIGL